MLLFRQFHPTYTRLPSFAIVSTFVEITSGNLSSCAMILAVDDLFHVLAACDVDSLIRCAQTSTLFRTAVAAEIRFRIAALLLPFFGDRVRRWNGLLHLHKAIMSGSLAVALFASPTDWTPGDLDVYVGSDAYGPFIVDFERLFPVTLQSDMTRRPRGTYSGIRRVRRYLTSTGKRIEIIQSRCPNAAEPLRYFWSSLVVNFITPHGAVCAFPTHTLAGKGLVEGELHDKGVRAKKKYEDRGFQFDERAYWQAGWGLEPGPANVFSNVPLLVLDFQSVWRSAPFPLPIRPLGSRWLFDLPPLGSEDSPRGAERDSASKRSTSLG
ncbi:hypothetical protein GSI_12006 [Ganoderma sinense ZZ0214-1]|uniref:Uncharacterized protein n=1 Tax=Ganoderma sinense ZZ0214-1 TaxID=1077348 RepID=A0A2G8RXL3_9APHY|nr:hypothetical protein GSI_12006 [Ganoderma sinense ZZ0214-1]